MNNLTEVENTCQEKTGVINLHPLDYLSGQVYLWQRNFARFHRLVRYWTTGIRPRSAGPGRDNLSVPGRPQYQTDYSKKFWVKNKAAAVNLEPLPDDLVFEGLASKGVTVVLGKEGWTRRDVSLALGERRGCICG